MTIYSAVLIGCQRVTDRQTDVQLISITCFSIADARKNWGQFYNEILTDVVLIDVKLSILFFSYGTI